MSVVIIVFKLALAVFMALKIFVVALMGSFTGAFVRRLPQARAERQRIRRREIVPERGSSRGRRPR